MTFAYDTCKSCGKPFVDHDGIIGTCAKLQAVQAELDALKKLERDRWTGWAKDVNIIRMKFCPVCGNKRCPKADSERYKCTNSNALNQIGELEAADEATEPTRSENE